jgi:hypothetical protein
MMSSCRQWTGFVLLCFLFASCMEQKPVQRIEELEALKGKPMGEVLQALGNPKVIDSSASPNERIFGYYQVMIRSEVDAKPRQRTVLVVLRKHTGDFVVDEVRIP